MFEWGKCVVDFLKPVRLVIIPLRFNCCFTALHSYRWDGVDRGNGFEQRLLAAMTASRVNASAKYKWSSSGL